MAVAIKDAIAAVCPDPINSKDQNVRDAFQIARHIRNVFAHSPFCPIWSVDKKDRNKLFEVPATISLNTRDLHGKAFDWPHYGGPLAILKLCWFVRFEILKDKAKRPYAREVSPPRKRYIQQGSLVLEEVKRIPKGARRISASEALKKIKVVLISKKSSEHRCKRSYL